MRVSIYARYSSDLQRAASIEDQVLVCTERVVREKWTLAATYTDRGISGASHLRPGYQKLLEGARKGEFDIVLAEALDRISRDQEHVASFFKLMSFAGIRIVTLTEGEISELHVGLKGTMNALFLKDLADKTRRGLRGRIEQGRSGGGLWWYYSQSGPGIYQGDVHFYSHWRVSMRRTSSRASQSFAPRIERIVVAELALRVVTVEYDFLVRHRFTPPPGRAARGPG